MCLKYAQIQQNQSLVNALNTEAMLMMTCIIRAGKSSKVTAQIDEDSYSRIVTCLRVISSVPKDNAMVESFLRDSRAVFGKLLAVRDKTNKPNGNQVKAQVDSVISYRLLKPKKEIGKPLDHDVADISRATGVGEDTDVYVSKLDRIFQLSGYSDPVYVEAYVTVHQFDILMDILIVNQTKNTLQNMAVEFSTLGDLKLVERPAAHTIGPHGYHSVKVNFKVSSTESGVIFGSVVYDGNTASDFNCVFLNDIQVDILDYIKPLSCSPSKFRTMWDEFEWENKINVITPIHELKTYLDFVLKVTNMKSLTPNQAGDCGFLSANLYAQSIFGEDALANVCLEETDGVVSGHIRIRSKTQGIALSLGEKISLSQKHPEHILAQ